MIKTIEGLNPNFSIVSAIIERERNGTKEVLIQTRWKPENDPVYSGTLEIPAGGLNKYENVYEAVKREVFEETELKVIGFKPELRRRAILRKMTIVRIRSLPLPATAKRRIATGRFCLSM